MGLSTHVLDTSLGQPAAGIAITLHVLENDSWTPIGSSRTNPDGRCSDLLPTNWLPPGTWRLRFEVAPYFAAQNLPSLFPFIEITFIVRDSRNHHIPLLLSAHGYTTYRGS